MKRLGAGGMGVVYQVYDRERARAVALKTLRRRDAGALYRFKREFRGLADISHPNLAALHELVSSGDDWFFTMELVDGVDFITWVRGDADIDPHPPTRRMRGPAEPERVWEAPLPSPPGSYDRLRDGMRQLAEGVHALHDAGKLHRDIKPSNVMVDRSGRVVLLDFGLITDVARRGGGVSDDFSMVGTVDYMSPEQSASLQLGPASDWYSVGTVLYRALTGASPFVGPPMMILLEKQRREPDPPRQLLPGTPADLSQLCADLLRRDPAARPDGGEILRRLGGRAAPRRPPPSEEAPLVGRGRHAALLRDAFATASREGRPVTVLVHGRSGMGKSMLIERVTGEMVREHHALVLAGRCHERESVPYKALDSVIDALSRILARLPEHEVDAMLPRDALAVTRLFPVLRRVASIKGAPRRAGAPDPHELRRRGLVALRELMARLADRRPLVLVIDDLQWGDLDSTMLLLDLLRPPDPPALLLILAYRSEEAQASQSVRTLVDGLRGGAVDVRDVEIGALAPDEAGELVRLRLEEGAPELADAIVRESAGDPFLIDQLVRHLRDAGGEGEISFGEVMRTQLEQLGPDARRALELVAVAARPLSEMVVARAAGLEREDQVMAVLRAGSLVRGSGALELGRIETYHDRIRDAVVASLSEAEQRERHMALADALEWSERPDPEALAVHLLGAGDVERGTEYAIEAAGKALAALAFERAAVLYRLAIDALPPEEVARRRLRAALGDALVSAGRGVDAAAEYVAAAEGSPAAEGLELRRRAAEQLLRSGRADDGLRALETVLQAVGMNLAPTPRRAIWSFLRQRMRGWLRGMRYRERDPSQVSVERLARVDICWSVAVGIGMTDPVRGVDFQTRHLHLALAAGEPYRVSRALAMEVCYTSLGGRPTWKRTQKLLGRARDIADRIDQPHARGLAAIARGMVDYQTGRWGAAFGAFEEAVGILRTHCTGVAFEIGTAQRMALDSLFYMGAMGELCRRVPQHLTEAERRGDLYVPRDICTGLPNAAWLVLDDPATARAQCERGRTYRSQLAGFYLQHYYELVAATHIDLYTGDGEAAHRRITEQWPMLRRSMLLRFQVARVASLFLRGRSALAAAAAAGGAARARLLAEVDRTARRLDRQALAGARPQASALAAGAAAMRGQVDMAVQLLAQAESRFQTAEMELAATAARHRRGELTGGAAGERLVAASEDWMRSQTIRNPAAMTRLFC
ncbi:MAG TPA: AAA family ATPase [Kofleriaceae bacterium]|nr:AAA family ATPase [Kofleriaceae bacterium]